jgi:peptidoglycan-associated lipoprotein
MCKKLAILWLPVLISVAFFGCRPDYPKCDKDNHCNEGEYCVNNLCQQCRDNGDCPEGQECEGGACREIPDYCTQSSDCASGQICRDNRCSPCFSDADCETGQICMDGVCGEPECSVTEDCAAGLSCINRRCQTDSAAGGLSGSGDCNLEEVYFEFDSSELSQEARRVVEKNYDCASKMTGTLTLEGHCDSRGTTEYNMALGERRARIVSKVVKTLGMDKSRVRVISKGKEEAIGRDAAGWAKDRKVVFK